MACCPAHDESNPSCSVTIGPDGTLRWRCFGCSAGGNALHLVAVVHGLDIKRDFPRVLRAAAEIGHTKSRFLTYQYLGESAKGMKAIDEIGVEQLETLIGINTAVRNNEINIDVAFPEIKKPEATVSQGFAATTEPTKETEEQKRQREAVENLPGVAGKGPIGWLLNKFLNLTSDLETY